MSVQRILANNTNAVLTASITATGVNPSTLISRTGVNRQGNGQVSLTGAYTGQTDATFDIQITSATGNARVSTPVFTGSGSGTLTNVNPGTLGNQEVLITCADMGTPTAKALLDFYGVTLQAKNAGDTGNSITIEVNETGITTGTSSKSLFADISANTETLKGPENDFYSKTLSGLGDMHPESQRFRIGDDPQIFRQYRTFVANEWEYHLVPPAPRSLAKGSPVTPVTGTYSVTITNGTTTNTYSNIVTLYDCLLALVADPLVEVIGAVTKDLQPQGMATIDLPLRTVAYHLPVIKSNSSAPALEAITIKDTAPTETLLLEVVDNTLMGAEVWSVTGSTSGKLTQARTGIAYTASAAPAGFTIPQWLPEIQTSDITGPSVVLTNVSYASRGETEVSPEILVRKGRVGRAGKAMTLTATYTKYMKTEDCDAEEATLTGSITDTCLGITDPEPGGVPVALDPEYQSRLMDIYQWEITASAGEIGVATDTTTTTTDGTTYTNYKAIYSNGNLAYFQTTVTDAPLYTVYIEIPQPDPGGIIIPEYSIKNAGSTTTTTHKSGYANPDVSVIQQCRSILVDTLAQVWSVPAGLTAFDTFFTNVQTLCTAWIGSQDLNEEPPDNFYASIRAQANYVLVSAGIVPGKDEGSVVSTGCWTDLKKDYWEIKGYAPAYTNTAYISTKFSSNGAPYSTKEFGFFIACKCTQHLKYGDQLTIEITGGATSSKTYQVGDSYEIPIISGAPVPFSGGVSGDDTVTWNVQGMTDGALDALPVVNNMATTYSDTGSGFGFRLTPGGIPFALGDQFTLSVEGGMFKWRKDGGTWSAETAIGTTLLTYIDNGVTKDYGLTATFTPGASPSFVQGDTFTFAAKQSATPFNIRTPKHTASWSFTGAQGVTITAAATISCIAILHTLPAGKDITVTGITDLDEITTGATGIEVVEFDQQAITAVTLDFPESASVAWVYLGKPLTTEFAPASIELRRQWEMIRGQKNNFGALYLTQGYAGKISWDKFISKAEFDSHLAMIDHCKQNSDEPILFVPHHLHPEEAFLCRIELDQVDMVDMLQFHPNTDTDRLMSLTIPFAPVTR